MKTEACADDGWLRRPCPVNVRLAADAIRPAGLLDSCARRNDTVADLPFGPSFAIYSVRVICPEDALHLPAYNFMSISRAHIALFRC